MNDIKYLFSDDDLMVINKPAGLVVHNPPGRHDISVIDIILRRFPKMKNLNWPDSTRPGIVHRLDKDTSGLLIIAKTPMILTKLQNQFKNRDIDKEYTALVFGNVSPQKGSIVADIARHKSKDKQTIVSDYEDGGKEAQTDYETLNHYKYNNHDLTLVLAKPKTGRMHQIRIHFKHLGYPIIGDQMYFFKPSKRLSKELGISRQFLHATKLTFTHPMTNNKIIFKSIIAKDLNDVLIKLNKC